VPSATTHDIRVDVQSVYLPQQSNPAEHQYVFAYTIEILNESEATVQLERRHWYIMHGDGREEEVEGAGVVGEQPLLEPGEGFRYTSGCALGTPHGTMHGTYQMRTNAGRVLQVEIPPFSLSVPFALN
jgi:ApaG protein